MDKINTYNSQDDFMDELKASAFEFLLLNPGGEFGDWRQGLVEQYPTEVVDALGTDPELVYAGLADLWETDYCDPATGMEQKFSDWAMSFANEHATDVYYSLIGTCRKLKELNLM